MNKIDIENIKKELEKRNYKFKKGGDLTKYTIESYTDRKLQKLIDDYNKNNTSRLESEIKSLVDSIFSRWSDESDDNMIVLDAAYCPEKRVVLAEDALSNIDFGDEELYKPIGRFWEGRNYWSRAEMSQEELERIDNTIWNPFFEDINRLESKVHNLLEVSDASEYFEDDVDYLNECWYGVLGIMKDYRVVSFIIRDDGLLNEEKSISKYPNQVIYHIR
jgi:hypothetical protein